MALRPSTKTEYRRTLEAVQEWITCNYQADITLDDFCRIMHYSRRSVQRALSHHGTSWRKLLTRERLYVAGERLINTDMPIGQLAHSVGYRQSAQFAKAFKAQFGLAPLPYRQAFRNKEKVIA